MDRVSSGIYGLDGLIGGGYKRNTVNGILGGSGTGKTIFGMQFLLNGLHKGEYAFFISLEENPKKLLEEAKSMGFPEMEDFVRAKRLIIKHSGGANLKRFMEDYLPSLVKAYAENSGHGTGLRVFIDPITPLLWELKGKSEQREFLSDSFNHLRKIGTTLVSIEEAGFFKDLRYTEETATPIYLCDTIVHLRYMEISSEMGGGRTLRIQKFRSSSHGEGIYPFAFVPGLGVVLSPVEKDDAASEQDRSVTAYENIFKKAANRIKKNAPVDLKNILLLRVDTIKKNWSSDQSPDSILDEFCAMYGL